MPFNYSRRIYLADTDAAGVVFFTKGLEICHEAYEESLATAGILIQQILLEGKIALPIDHAEIDFWHPLFCGDLLQVKVIANQINQTEFAIAYEISTLENLNRILVKAQTRHICINPQRKNKVERVDLPYIILKWLEKNSI